MVANSGSYDRVKELVAQRVPVVVATVVRGAGVGRKLIVTPDAVDGTLGDAASDGEVIARAKILLEEERSGVEAFGETEVFFDVMPPSPQLIIVGAVHIAQAMVTFAKALGFRIVVIDARQQLATRERFPDIDELLVEWPDDAFAHLDITPNTFIAILTHDPKFDEPALVAALETPARYIGAIGSRKTNADRRQRLVEAGVSEASLARLRGPIGLDLGGSAPEEVAISILAEMIAVKHGRSGGSLVQSSGPIRAVV